MRYIVGALTTTVAVSSPYFAVSLMSSHIKQLTKNFIVLSLHNSVISLVAYSAEDRETENTHLVVLPKDLLTCAETSSAEKQEVVAESILGISLNQLTVTETGSSEKQEAVPDGLSGSRYICRHWETRASF